MNDFADEMSCKVTPRAILNPSVLFANLADSKPAQKTKLLKAQLYDFLACLVSMLLQQIINRLLVRGIRRFLTSFR